MIAPVADAERDYPLAKGDLSDKAFGVHSEGESGTGPIYFLYDRQLYGALVARRRAAPHPSPQQ
jgi:hypothetical protein